MYGNAPHGVAGGPEPTPADRRELRREMTAVTARARKLLPAAFVVGAEVVAGADGLRATVAVQPPAGSVVSAGFEPGEAGDLAHDLAAGAALEAKRSGAVSPTAR